MPCPVIIIHPNDNVAVALRDLKSGEILVLPDGATLTTTMDIPFSHKVALSDLPTGATIIKYGENIGCAKTPIGQGEWIHTHNLSLEEVL